MKADPIVRYIRRHGPIPAVRVSSAQAKGRAKQYSYWGAVRYEIRCAKRDDALIAMPCERASSDRRVRHLAVSDARALAHREDRLMLPTDEPTIRQWIERREADRS